jgi:surface protein
MNNLAFQIYGSTKSGIFQSTWDTTLVSALGGEQAAISASGTGWALNTGATNLNVGGYKHTAGSTTNLTTTMSAVIMQMYKITYTISSRTAGSVTINYGGVSTSGITSSASVDILAIATTVFSITPTSDFDGVISISVKQTSSATNQVKLPLPNVGTYNIWVDWGDGTYDNITSWNSIKILHTYPVGMTTPTIRISGSRFNWSPGADALKIKSVSSWGKLILGNATFAGCANVTMSGITDIPDLTGVTSLQGTFFSCSKITTIGRINEWNTSNITSTIQMFHSCTLFNSNISNWNVSNVTAFNQMFFTAGTFNNGYAYGVVNTLPWITTNATTLNQMFTGSAAFNSNISTFNVSKVVNFSQMFQNANSFNNGYASGVANQLPWTINTVSNVDMSSLFGAALAFNSNLGTGTTPWNVSKVTTFASMFQSASNFNNGDDTAPINNWNINTVSDVTMASMFNTASKFNRDISSWNVSKVTTFTNMFQSATAFNNGDNLNINPITLRPGIDGWNINTVSNVVMNSMFSNTFVFNRPIDNWNMTKVNNTSGMISYARAFNQPLSNWERSGSTMANVTDMNFMFAGSNVFNQDISNWNVSGVTNFSGMFSSTTLFNNGSDTNTNLITGRTGIDGWNINTASFVNMGSMFSGAGGNSYVTFNRPIGNWNTSKVTNMSNMFGKSGNGNHAFNQYIGDWDTSSVTNMGSMFIAGQGDGTASQFNQDISKWDVSKVTNFASMLSAKQFNNGSNTNVNPVTGLTGIDGWNINTVSNVSMASMFQNASVFNRPVGSWNVSKVTSMSNMFNSASAFNQPIGSWNTSAVTNMIGMFKGASVFNQNIGSWDVSQVTIMSGAAGQGMFQNATAFNNGGSSSIGGWDVSKVLNMGSNTGGMFNGATAFNQPIGSWNVSSVTDFNGFMFGKTPSTYSSTNLDAIYNGWIVNGVKPNINISFGTAKYSQAGKPGKDTLLASPNNWTITDGLLNVSGTSNNGGLIRVTTSAVHGFTTGNSVYIYGVNGTTNANGTWTITVVSTTVIELQGSTYNAAWTSGGNVILG